MGGEIKDNTIFGTRGRGQYPTTSVFEFCRNNTFGRFGGNLEIPSLFIVEKERSALPFFLSS